VDAFFERQNDIDRYHQRAVLDFLRPVVCQHRPVVGARQSVPSDVGAGRPFIQGVTEPILNPIRRLLPPMGGLDFSPMVVLLLARLLQGVVINLVR
jgi:hypothetical protein